MFRLRQRALHAPPDKEAFARFARNARCSALLFWIAWLAWWSAAQPLEALAPHFTALGRYGDPAKALPPLLLGAAVTVAMRRIAFPVYARHAANPLQQSRFLMHTVWSCCLFATFWLGGGEILRSLGESIRALAIVAGGALLVYGFGRGLLNAMGFVPRALEGGEFRDRVDALNRAAGIPPLRGLCVVYTTQMPVLNAFASTGRRLYLTEPLVRHLTTREMDAVVAHELAHLKHNHPLRFWRAFTLLAVAGAATGIALHELIRFLQTGAAGWPPEFQDGARGYLLRIAGLLAGIALAFRRGRAFETEADLEAASITQDPEAMISAIATIARESGRSAARPRRRRRYSTHPGVQERAVAIATAGDVPPDRVQALLAGQVAGEASYPLPPGPAPPR